MATTQIHLSPNTQERFALLNQPRELRLEILRPLMKHTGRVQVYPEHKTDSEHGFLVLEQVPDTGGIQLSSQIMQ